MLRNTSVFWLALERTPKHWNKESAVDAEVHLQHFSFWTIIYKFIKNS